MNNKSNPSSEMVSRQQAEETASRLIAQRETGPWTAQDAAGLEAWLAESPSHRAAYYRFHAAWKEAGRMTALASWWAASCSTDERSGHFANV